MRVFRVSLKTDIRLLSLSKKHIKSMSVHRVTPACTSLAAVLNYPLHINFNVKHNSEPSSWLIVAAEITFGDFKDCDQADCLCSLSQCRT